MKVKFFLINFVFLLANISISFAKIQWTTLSPEQAFLKAKQEGKYLFVYWGAVWCPPCNQIKKNIFTNPLFQQELNEHFLSLYLDGDQPEAQTWGDKLRSSGYPTLLILSPEAKEIL
jgi:thioredoxin-related protein